MARARARIRLRLGIDINREGYRLGYRLALPVCPFRPLEVTQKALKVKVLTLFILEVSRRLRHAMPRPSLPHPSALLARSLSTLPHSRGLFCWPVCFAY